MRGNSAEAKAGGGAKRKRRDKESAIAMESPAAIQRDPEQNSTTNATQNMPSKAQQVSMKKSFFEASLGKTLWGCASSKKTTINGGETI